MTENLEPDNGVDGVAEASRSPQDALAWRLPLLLLVAVAIVFGRVVTQDFVRLDDDIHIYANPFFRPGASLIEFWRHPYQGLYIPVAYTVMGWLAPLARIPLPNRALSDTGALYNPHVFHLVNLVVHAINVLLVFVLLRMLTRKPNASAFGALVFAVHPLQVESVAWISEFRGLFASVLSLSALVCYVYATRARRGKALAWAGWAVLAALAVLCKPAAVAIPLVALAIDALFLRRPLRAALIATIPLLLAYIPLIHATQALQPALGSNVTPPWTRPFIAGDALAFYLVKLVAPIHLVLDYGRSPQKVLASGIAWRSWLLPVAAAVAVWRVRGRLPWLIGAAVVMLAAVAPVLGLTPFRFQDLSTVADRYMYVAMLGPAIAAAYLFDAAGRPGGRVALAAIVLIWAGLSIHQVHYWDNSMTVLTHSLKINPNSTLLESNLAATYAAHGKTALALRHYDRSIALDAQFFNPRLNRADILMNIGKYDAAKSSYEEILRLWPQSRMARMRLGQIDERLGREDDALRAYTALVAAAPDFQPAHVRRGILLLSVRRLDLAAAEFQIAVHQNPYDSEAWTGLANVATVAGSPDLAMQAYARASVLDPTNDRAAYDLGLMLLSAHRFPEAVAALRRAAAAKPGDAGTRDTLGVALFNSGDRPSALKEFEAALKIDPRNASANAHAAALYGMR
ncbi:MAG: tetratricopeptide repeat protein [Capsulimonadaceae bacterium]|nr:tetratricopeptide repeat protein [Capsulimonadaceae bacterium]